MKKFLAVMMSIVMMVSLVAVPVSAAEDEVTFDDVVETVSTTIELIQDTLIQVHNIVGSIMAVLQKECPLCGEIHEILHEDGFGDAEVETPELPGEDTEAVI